MKAEEILLAALEKANSAERAVYLDGACGQDAQLRAVVEGLLKSHEEAGSFLEQPLFEPTPTIDQPARSETLATHIGPYKLLEQIGEGGMGTVWMAQQTEPVKRVVALKFIKAGMDSKQVIARFEAERQALAMMDHANIAKVLDGGTTAAGRPYFVMDLVKGVPITKYCDEHHLTPRQRLELFLPVCQAVQHAHQKGIIHRDLKPSNILVASYDGRPVVKVIDFGVAKAVGQPLTENTLVTKFGAVVGTPEYMSPEQAELNNQDIDTRSDIYSLGVLLYELLTGTTPIEPKRFKNAAILEMLRLVREEEPPRPSSRLSSTESRASIAADRGSEPARLARELRGELDWIAMKALEKVQARRYETANALARDIQRYLADEVVEARPPSMGYRLQKFVRHYKGRVAAGTLILLGLIGGLIGTAYGVIEGRNQRMANSLREQAEVERDAAEKARGEAETARLEAETARDGARAARAEAEREKTKLAVFEYGRTIQVAHQEWRNNNLLAARTLLEGTRKNFRGWEWHYVHRLCHADLLTLKGHTSNVVSAEFSSDGSRVLTGSQDGTARVWDARTGAPLLVLERRREEFGKLPESLSSAAFSPDGTRVVTSFDNTARVWDAKSGAELLVLKGHTKHVGSAAFSPDGTRVVTAGWDNTARVWDARSGDQLLLLEGHTNMVRSAEYSSDGSRVVTASSDGTVRMWDAKTGAVLLALERPTLKPALSPDGSRLVILGLDNTAQVVDAKTGAELLVLRGHTDRVRSVAISRDGARVVTGSYDKTARVWDAKTGSELLALRGHTHVVESVAFSPDGARVVTAGSWDRTARVWDARSGAEFLTFKPVHTAAFSPDGARVVAGIDDKTARVWDTRTGAELLALRGHTERIWSAAFNRDGTRLVTGSADKTARVWDAGTGAELVVLKGHTDRVLSAAFSPDGTRVVTESEDNTARVWDAKTGAEMLVLKGRPIEKYEVSGSLAGKPVMRASFSPDGEHLLTVSQEARVCNARTGAELPVLKVPTSGVSTAGFSPDGTRLITAKSDDTGWGRDAKFGATARVWDASTGALLLTFKGHGGRINSAKFSADGSRVVTASDDSTARVWDARTGGDPLVLKGHTGGVYCAAFSPDGSRVVTSSWDATVRVWDAVTGAELLTLRGHTSDVFVAEFSPDGAQILTSKSYDLTAKVWDSRPINQVFVLQEAGPPPRELVPPPWKR